MQERDAGLEITGWAGAGGFSVLLFLSALSFLDSNIVLLAVSLFPASGVKDRASL